MSDLYAYATHLVDLEHACQDNFGVQLKIKRIISDDISTSDKSNTTVFETDNHTIYAFCRADSKLTLSDVKHIMKRMGMEVEAFLPPRGIDDYFVKFSRQAFTATYPGRNVGDMTAQQRAFYQDLAPYSPALVRVGRVKGEIREYFAALQRWQRSRPYSYARIKVQ